MFRKVCFYLKNSVIYLASSVSWHYYDERVSTHKLQWRGKQFAFVFPQRAVNCLRIGRSICFTKQPPGKVPIFPLGLSENITPQSLRLAQLPLPS